MYATHDFLAMTNIKYGREIWRKLWKVVAIRVNVDGDQVFRITACNYKCL